MGKFDDLTADLGPSPKGGRFDDLTSDLKPSPSIAEKIEPGVYGDTDPGHIKGIVDSLGEGMGTGELAGLGVTGLVGGAKGISSGIGAIFSPEANLMSAGIKPGTIANMAPRGTNPALFGKQLEDTLSQEGALGKTASETFDRLSTLKAKAGKAIGNIFQKISSQPIRVNAQDSIQPILDGWAEHADAATTAGRRMAKPFEQVYNKLASVGARNGGLLDLDSVDSVMDEIGPLTHKGPEDMQLANSRLYGKLADVRDGMVKKIADLSNDPSIATDLLSNNARYSRYSRLMPDVTRASAAEPIKAGVSTFQKLKGPQILKYGGAGLAGAMGADSLKSLFRNVGGGG